MPDVTITPTEDGPYLVSGPVAPRRPDGHEIDHLDPDHLPLRTFVEQAVLRRHARRDRLRRNAGELIAERSRRL